MFSSLKSYIYILKLFLNPTSSIHIFISIILAFLLIKHFNQPNNIDILRNDIDHKVPNMHYSYTDFKSSKFNFKIKLV